MKCNENGVLNGIRIATPCKADWNQMVGDDHVRLCQLCELNVYNLSAMSRQEAESLVQQKEGRLCVRFYQRTDGMILTQNCPVGLRAVRRRLAKIAGALAAVFALLFQGATLLGLSPRSCRTVQLRNLQPFAMISDWLRPAPPPLMGKIVMGDLVQANPRQQPPGEASAE